jgi:hypothetical protein
VGRSLDEADENGKSADANHPVCAFDEPHRSAQIERLIEDQQRPLHLQTSVAANEAKRAATAPLPAAINNTISIEDFAGSNCASRDRQR